MPLNTHEWCGFPVSEVEGGVDAENRLVSVTKGNHRTEFVYDGLGRRVQILEKDIAADQTTTTTSDRKFLWAGTEIAEERSGDDGGTVQKRFFAQGFVERAGTTFLFPISRLSLIWWTFFEIWRSVAVGASPSIRYGLRLIRSIVSAQVDGVGF